MQKSDPLIHTKLRPPFVRPNLVPRTRLQAQIVAGLQGPLTLIIAPAGFGKTTLVTASLSAIQANVAWLSLDKDDNRAGYFLRYLIAALQQTDSEIGNEAAQLLASRQQASEEAVLPGLINDLDAAGKEWIVVLDDYQFISSQAVHTQITFLLEHCPHNLHLLIATRSDPPLPLARLRARGQLLELRTADLRFTAGECTQFLNDVMGLCLDAVSVTRLEQRTEGWVAGLQMAALSMREREDKLAFIEGFSGTNRHILDYLMGEVLASQPADIQRFLLYTSILERLSAPLCDAILGIEKGSKAGADNRPAAIPQGSISILQHLERVNLFLVPLDDERQWYRYHQLFADLLRNQLQKSSDPQEIARLHVRASDWHEKNGSLLEAIHHASMASDEERLERLIEQQYMELVSHGEQFWLRSWSGKLSKELVYRRPWLCIYQAYSHSWFGELDQADMFLEAAEKRIRSDMTIPDADAMLAHLTYIKSRVTGMRGDLPRAIEFNLAAHKYLTVDNLALQLDLDITLGYLYFQNGDFINAGRCLQEVLRSGKATGAVINTVGAYYTLARLYAIQGRLKQSYDLYEQAAQWIQESGGQHHGASSLIEVGIADLLCEWNELDSALARVKQGLNWMHLWGKADDLALACITLSRICLAQSNLSDAEEAIHKATHAVRTSAVFPEALHAVELAQVKFWLSRGDLQAAGRWIASAEGRFGSDVGMRFEHELDHMARARGLVAQKRLEEALALLSQLENITRSSGRTGRLIEILLVESLALQKIRDFERSILTLTECLTLAEPEGYVRVFLDEGQPMQRLLTQWLSSSGASPVREYVIHLLSFLEAGSHPIAPAHEKRTPAGDLVEQLTARELEVLQHMALGRTNQEIARHFVLAPGTIKAHTASIYRKLDVSNRTEAVARARQLGILP